MLSGRIGRQFPSRSASHSVTAGSLQKILSADEGTLPTFHTFFESHEDDINPLEVVGGGDENLKELTKLVQENEDKMKETVECPRVGKDDLVPVVHVTESVDDFIRNYMYQMGLTRTLDCFETEWYELHKRDLINDEKIGLVPDVFTRCQQLEEIVSELQMDIDKYRAAADKIKDKFTKVCKERDYHRMHHRRAVQEKNKIIAKIALMERHYADFEPTMKNLQKQYERSIKERVFLMLAKDSAVAKARSLEALLKAKTKVEEANRKSFSSTDTIYTGTAKEKEVKPLQPTGEYATFPPDQRICPALAFYQNIAYHAEEFGYNQMFHPHKYWITGVSCSKEDNTFVTASDDNTWKLWTYPPTEDPLAIGRGHEDWLSHCAINPQGNKLATTSADRTVKIWDLPSAQCINTFGDHIQPVLSCDWHSAGDFLVTGAMDCTIKVWDLLSLQCHQTLRGHKDDVNSVQFLCHSSILLSASSDKNINIWDARTSFCGHQFRGHLNSVLDATFNIQGNLVASVDSKGTMKLWDIRKVNCLNTFDFGPVSANCVIFDPSGNIVMVGSNDNFIHAYDCSSNQVMKLGENEMSPVLSLCFHPCITGLMLSGYKNGTVKFWLRRAVLR